MKKFASVEAYVKSFPPKTRMHLNALRRTIKKACPKAVEALAYSMVGYKLNGRPLVYIGGFKAHVGFFPGRSGIETSIKKAAKYKTGKGTLRFELDKPLPLGLVTRITKWRAREILKRIS